MSLKILFVILLIAGPASMLDSSNKAKEREKIAFYNMTTVGLIERGKTTVEGSKEDNFKFTVSFEVPPDNRRFVKVYSVDEEFFTMRVNSTWVLDPEVTIVYDPTDPMNSYLEGTEPDTFPTSASVIMALVGFGGLFYPMLSRGKD